MSIRFGVGPIALFNDDIPKLGGESARERALADAHATDFEGIELASDFPRDVRVLQTLLLRRFARQLVGGGKTLRSEAAAAGFRTVV